MGVLSLPGVFAQGRRADISSKIPLTQVNMSLPVQQGKAEMASGCVQIMRCLSGPGPSTRDEFCFDNPSHLSWA